MKNKIKFYAILIIISIPIYGLFNPIFTIVKEIEISGTKLISKNEIIQLCEQRQYGYEITYKACLNYVSANK